MRLLNKLKSFIRPVNKQPETVMEKDDFKLEASEVVIAPIKPKGRVIRHTKNKQWATEIKGNRGRVVRVMPKELQRIEEAQNGVESE